MTDAAQTKPASIRTDRARIRGLGAAHHGVEHWWAQRVTAIANIFLVFCFVIIMASAAGRPWPEAMAIVSNPFVAIALALLVISVTYHMRLGIQIVVEDYVHDHGLKLAANIANTFFAIAVAAACLFAIVKISFFRVLAPI